MTKYYIYHIPNVKIGVSTEPEARVAKQGYTDYEILETHKCIYEVSERERELQKQYGYKVDDVPYHISRSHWGSVAGTVGGLKCKKEKIGFLSDDFDISIATRKAYEVRKKTTNYKETKKPVEQYDKDGNYIKTFESIKEAALSVNGVSCGVGQVCNKSPRRKSYKGYVWKFVSHEEHN
jgi:hypothetical protein